MKAVTKPLDIRRTKLFIGVLLSTFAAAAFGAASPAPAQPVTSGDVIDHLNKTIAWYSRINTVDQTSSAPQNLLLQDTVRQSAKQVVRTAFAFARAQAAYLSGTKKGSPQGDLAAPSTEPSSDLGRVIQASNDRVQNLQTKIEELNAQLEKTPARKQATLIAQRDTLSADLNLAKTAQSALKNLQSFAKSSDASGGLLGQINFLQNSDSIPVAFSDTQTAQPATRNNSAVVLHPESAGLMTLITDSVTLLRARGQISSLIESTQTLNSQVTKVSGPLRSRIRSLIQQGDNLASAAAGETDEGQLADARAQINSFTAQFKLLSGPITPLGEQGLALDSTRAGLEQWKSALTQQLDSVAGFLAFRLGSLAAVIAVIFVISEIFRRATLRYVRDTRLRRQFVLLRRVVVGFTVTLIAALTFFSGFGSFATIAGFVTAGLAVALQNVILSVVAYFFLIGRYGLRAGDRVSLGGVNGQVLEVGLVRLSVMEFAGTGIDVHSTGRIAVFSNSVIFQPSALIKQAPGTEYTWHNITAVLAAETDLEDARKRLVKAVKSVFDSYQSTIEAQNQVFERLANIQLSDPQPVSRARLIDTGIEIVIRYPVEISCMSDIDEQMINHVMDEISREPKLQLASGGFPKVSAA